MFKKVLSVLFVAAIMACSALAALTACGHEHEMEFVERHAPTCASSGMAAHWKCTSCGKLFADESGLTEVTEEELVIEATGDHVFNRYLRCENCGQMAPGYTQAGNVVYAYTDENESAVCAYAGAAGAVEIVASVSGRQVVRIDGSVFEDAPISSVKMPEGILSIGSEAFQNSDIQSLELPGTLRELGSNAFSSCLYLSGSVTIPGSVENMGTHIFYNCRALKEVVIEEGVTELSSFMFMNCSALETLTIPASVTRFGQSVLARCSSLTTVHYGGTIAQWKNISKGFGWDAGANCVVYCTDGQI